MTCQCGNNKFINFSGKTGDMTSIFFNGIWKHGSVPRDIGIGGGDYVEFSFCIACGKLENFKPLTEEQVKEILED